ncbi:response regulator transcription factor [Amycolatopsis rubida]|uniref:DNA-binding response regulator, NarL/FixJ family, contains REC and HTH domains n=2 Tax=Pseudonocardiaceae TaxID=2070 RepID=A0A1I5VKR3_9PSEU|nr:LuxR C-terminal-related transcriptional regulator [Amycolatopsis rubida]MYW93780.1 DNA-binding response regulator [Amycolatopsis rubida]NEC58769.1 response regulator transcription factor [Amycolatopsis rubida]OAP22967.1 Transcriptional regulatory protein DegU [Amycolatopsis sp. M39]SFQ08134.1 DNA-binding response regulator, NarL/FixJ family, contains REC and HTH domains [Amycolatopsis rubida]
MNNSIGSSETAARASVAVAVHSSDVMSKLGMTRLLAAERRFKLLTEASEFAAADVILLIEESVRGETLALPERIRAASPLKTPPRCVIVADDCPESLLLPAIGCGLAALLPRGEIDTGALIRTIAGVSRGAVDLPPPLQACLLAELDRVVNEVLKPRGIMLSGVSAREREVLRLLAEGCDTDEIAAELVYSRSLIKNIIREVMDRYGLRNRSHAVAYAIRRGII